MPKFAEFFASLDDNGGVVLVAQAYPPHELLPNQIMLTPKEYSLLKSVRGVDEAYALLRSIGFKIGEVLDAKDK
jgi:hypothetical protein